MLMRHMPMHPKKTFLIVSFLLSIWLFPSQSLPGTSTFHTMTADQRQDHQCLALNIYWEARSEPVQGQHAIAAVTLNRMRHATFPDTICQVVKQGGENRHRCQFSWWCDGKSDTPDDPEAWTRAQQIAWSALEFDQTDPTQGALFYHATYVKPDWVKTMTRTTKIGRHLFFTNPTLQSQFKEQQVAFLNPVSAD